MRELPVDIEPGAGLEDAAVIIETAGHLPEVALQELVFHELGELSLRDRMVLDAAVARAYLRLIRADLDPGMIGRAGFRGPERALVNWRRLQRFLQRGGWSLPGVHVAGLALALEGYLKAEQEALEQGRGYASISPEVAKALADAWGVELGRWEGVVQRLNSLEVADFIALRAFRRLEVEGVVFKRRRWRATSVVIEVLDEECRALRSASLPLAGPWGRALAEDVARVELVWRLAGLRAGWTYMGRVCARGLGGA